MSAPVAWYRRFETPGSVHGPAEHDVEAYYGEEQPDNSGKWLPLYAKPSMLAVDLETSTEERAKWLMWADQRWTGQTFKRDVPRLCRDIDCLLSLLCAMQDALRRIADDGDGPLSLLAMTALRMSEIANSTEDTP